MINLKLTRLYYQIQKAELHCILVLWKLIFFNNLIVKSAVSFNANKFHVCSI